jgi:hypothetical protein
MLNPDLEIMKMEARLDLWFRLEELSEELKCVKEQQDKEQIVKE